MNQKAFSLVEIIISMSIIVLLAFIGLSSFNKNTDNINNTKVISDIQTINNGLLSYYQESNTLPLPDGNTNFYKIDTTYSHTYNDNETFGVYGSITQKTIPKKYLDILPLDPRNNSYYSYGKTKGSNQFELASFQINESDTVSYVIGNYTGENGPYNLIREYNGPNFVYNKSKSNFPYNPYELLLVGKVSNITGNVTIQTKGGNTISDTNNIYNYILGEGDTILVDAGGEAEINFSDGSTSIIGDSTKNSEVKLEGLHFKGKDNISTFIKLFVSAGTIWTKATHLDESSQFEIHTTDSSAAVRGTIFGVTKNPVSSEITVIEGKVEISQNNTFLKDINIKKGETPKKIKITESINNIEIIEIDEPIFSYGLDIRGEETVKNINMVTEEEVTHVTEEEEEVTTTISGIGCGECPNGSYKDHGLGHYGCKEFCSNIDILCNKKNMRTREGNISWTYTY